MKIFIPIKKKSQRLRQKNFRIFNGVPLYQHFVFKLLDLDFDIFIDTDSQEILKWSKDIDKVTCYDRPKHLCGHEVSVNSLIENFIETFGINESVIQLHVTSPLLKSKTIKDASKYLEKGYDSVVSCDVMYERFWTDELDPVNHDPSELLQTQDLQPIYIENSAFYMFKSDMFSRKNNRIGDSPYFYEVDYPENLDIDTEEDWKRLQNV